MKKNNKSLVLAFILFVVLVAACGEKKNMAYWDNAPVVAERAGEVITLDPALLKDTIVFPLSHFIEDIEIVKLDDKDEPL